MLTKEGKVYINGSEIIEKAQNGDGGAMNDIVLSNLGLVKSIAVKFLDRGADFDDLVQIGSIGIIKAVKGYKKEFGTAFSTYAVPMIAGEIKRFLRDDGIVKVSREAKTNANKIFRFIRDYEGIHKREPTVKDISETLLLSEEEIVFALEASQPIVSLYAKNDEDEFALENRIGVDTIEEELDSIVIRDALEKLEQQEALLIRLRFFRGLTQQQTAKILGVTQVKVSREEKRICEKLKGIISG